MSFITSEFDSITVYGIYTYIMYIVCGRILTISGKMYALIENAPVR